MKALSRKGMVAAATALMVCIGMPALAQPYQPPSGTILIRPLGDSITYGVGFADNYFCPVYDPSWQRWCPAPLAMGGGYRGWLTWIVLNSGAQPPLTFATEGHQNGGSYTQQWQFGTQAHDGYPGFRTDQLIPASSYASFADVTLVHAGTNDIIQSKSVDDAANNLFTILNNLLTQNGETHVFVAQIIPFAKPAASCQIGTTPCTDYSGRNAQVTQYNTLLQQKLAALPDAQRNRITLVDMNGLLNGNSGTSPDDDYFIDGIHPGPMGYMKMACTWIRAIKVLPPPPTPPAGQPTNYCQGIGPAMPQLPPMPTPTPEQMEQMMQSMSQLMQGPPPGN